MSRLEYDPTPDGPTHPGRGGISTVRLVSLGALSLLGAALLVVGIMNYVLDAAPAALALDSGAAIGAMIAGGSLDAIASVFLFKQLRTMGKTRNRDS
ncbi:MAG: hypothetical protein AAF545_08010 [Pseudomonadota bacterium]